MVITVIGGVKGIGVIACRERENCSGNEDDNHRSQFIFHLLAGYKNIFIKFALENDSENFGIFSRVLKNTHRH